ncbi:MAG: guanylate kinase [Polyangiaceae bacterium]
MSASESFLMLMVSSPSGAGKTTLCSKLLSDFPGLHFSVSHTTRKPRPGEKDGREYHFVDEASFEKLIAEDRFVEWARVHGHSYGTSEAEIAHAEKNGDGIVFDIDFQGARQIRARHPEAVGVFILPPDLAELERRLRGRGTEDEATTQRRLQNAKREIAHYGLFDYVIVNDDVEAASARLNAIVYAERSRRCRHARRCEALLAASGVKREGGT